jgi:hypothetical protein
MPAAAAVLVLVAGASLAPAASPPAPVYPVATERIGTSVEGRPIGLVRVGDPQAARSVLVIGCIHGDECAARAVVARLAATDPATLDGAQLLLVRNINPDGFAHGTRQNAHGVDLNRNGAVGRRDLGPPGTRFYAGPKAFSEPESRAIRALILRERPDVVIWYHQPLTLIDAPESGWDGRARRYARLVGLPFRPLAHYPGSLSRWVNARVRPGSSFVVELPSGPLSAAAVRRHAGAVLTLAGVGRRQGM